jgi:hypothetical protein
MSVGRRHRSVTDRPTRAPPRCNCGYAMVTSHLCVCYIQALWCGRRTAMAALSLFMMSMSLILEGAMLWIRDGVTPPSAFVASDVIWCISLLCLAFFWRHPWGNYCVGVGIILQLCNNSGAILRTHARMVPLSPQRRNRKCRVRASWFLFQATTTTQIKSSRSYAFIRGHYSLFTRRNPFALEDLLAGPIQRRRRRRCRRPRPRLKCAHFHRLLRSRCCRNIMNPCAHFRFFSWRSRPRRLT